MVGGYIGEKHAGVPWRAEESSVRSSFYQHVPQSTARRTRSKRATLPREFACKLAGAKVVLVMGHTACGAIKGAIDNAQLGNLTGLLAKIRPAVEATQYQSERSAKNYGFVDAVARKNVELTMIDIHRRSPVLADLETSGAIKIAGAMYDLETGRVEFLA
jgi:carbonic anhydrase